MPIRCKFAIATALLCATAALLLAFAQENGDGPNTEVALLQGTWNFVSLEQNGIKQPQRKKGEEFKPLRFRGPSLKSSAGSTSMKLLVLVPPNVEVEQVVGLSGGYGGRVASVRPPTAINPTRDDPKPPLTKSKEGMLNCWLPPTSEDGWHEIPPVADVERRVSKVEKR